MKYIDAEKLIAEIEKRAKFHDDAVKACAGLNIIAITHSAGWKEDTEILAIITSLQQEQPEGLHFTPLNRLIQRIPSKNWNDTVNNYAKKLRDCLIKEGYLKDAEVLQGYISYMNGNNVPMATMDEQEQPEVDVEREIDEYYHENLGFIISPIDTRIIVENIARHFYSLGLNARKV